jgi:hypothetical protein
MDGGGLVDEWLAFDEAGLFTLAFMRFLTIQFFSAVSSMWKSLEALGGDRGSSREKSPSEFSTCLASFYEVDELVDCLVYYSGRLMREGSNYLCEARHRLLVSALMLLQLLDSLNLLDDLGRLVANEVEAFTISLNRGAILCVGTLKPFNLLFASVALVGPGRDRLLGITTLDTILGPFRDRGGHGNGIGHEGHEGFSLVSVLRSRSDLFSFTFAAARLLLDWTQDGHGSPMGLGGLDVVQL